jgi:hypothetical protein
MYDMSSTRSGGAPDESDTGLWTTETLPLSVRKELLERELHKLGFRTAGQGGSAREGGAQQQLHGSNHDHPQADAQGEGHAD